MKRTLIAVAFIAFVSTIAVPTFASTSSAAKQEKKEEKKCEKKCEKTGDKKETVDSKKKNRHETGGGCATDACKWSLKKGCDGRWMLLSPPPFPPPE